MRSTSLNFPSIVSEALAVSGNDFRELLEKTTELLRKEKGRIGNFSVNNRLVTLETSGEAVVIGDLHGDLESLSYILENSQFLEKMKQSTGVTLVFLGDYGDRGEHSVEVYYVVLNLKLAFPDQVVLMRGNHEAPRNLMAMPHDLPFQFRKKLDASWQQSYEMMWTLWSCLYNAVYVEDRYLMIHGGVSSQINSLQDISQAREGDDEAVLEDLLWSDPIEELQGIASSPRGAGHLFGENVTDEVLAKVNAKVLIRGHEASDEGFKINHGGKVLTLFSRKGAPYHNKNGAYLELPLAKRFDNTKELISCIRKF
jgi:protein phosphatase